MAESSLLVCMNCKLQLHQENAQRCSRCKVAIYCDAACQRAQWKTHKPLCKVGEMSTTLELATDVTGHITDVANVVNREEHVEEERQALLVTTSVVMPMTHKRGAGWESYS